jgi:hypothetical protein
MTFHRVANPRVRRRQRLARRIDSEIEPAQRIPMNNVRPTTDQPERTNEVVGALTLADVGPMGRHPQSLIFIVAAAGLALGRAMLILSELDGLPLDLAAHALVAAATETIVVLLPAALLWRIPSAGRTHRTLLAGLALGALAELLRLGAALAATTYGDQLPGPDLNTVASLVLPVASLLIGLGLLELRGGQSTRRGLLVVIASMYLAVSLVPVGADLIANEAVSATWLFLVVGIAAPLLAAFAAWVSADAWFAGDRPSRFWGLLALGVPLYVIAAVVSQGGWALATWVAMPADPLAVNDFGYVSATLGEIFALTAVCLAFVAYARLTPAAPDAS